MERGWYWRSKCSFCCENMEFPALFSKLRELCCVAGNEREHKRCCLPEPKEERHCSNSHILWAEWFCCLTLYVAGVAQVLAAELSGGGITCLAAVLRCLGQDQYFPDGRITKLICHQSQILLNFHR